MGDVYGAIADPTRRQLIELLATTEELPLHAMTSEFPMGRTAVSKHLSVLKEAGLVADRKVGRETMYRLTPEPLRDVSDWVAHYQELWAKQLDILKFMLEEEQR